VTSNFFSCFFDVFWLGNRVFWGSRRNFSGSGSFLVFLALEGNGPFVHKFGYFWEFRVGLWFEVGGGSRVFWLENCQKVGFLDFLGLVDCSKKVDFGRF
jgi:hypothetical protein